MSKEIKNRYDAYLVLLISSLAFGEVGYGDFLLPYRILEFILFPVFILRYNFCGNYLFVYMRFCVCFFLFCLLSLLWVPENNEASRYLAYAVFHFTLFLEIIVFAHSAKTPFRSISIGWLIAVALTLVVAIWEITTDNHLAMSKQESGSVMNLGNEIIYRRFASVTFYNYNSYVTFLCFALPFLFGSLLEKTSKNIRGVITILAIILSIICILFNASRGGFVSIIIMIIVYLFMVLSSKRKSNLVYLLILMFAATVVTFIFGENILEALEYKIGSVGFVSESRDKIWENAWSLFKSTYGWGVGIGGIKSSLKIPTHNIFLEILLEFGVLFFIIFIVYLERLFRKAWKMNDKAVKGTIFISLVSFPAYSIIDSGYFNHPFVFAAFSSLSVFAYQISLKNGLKRV